MPVRNYRDLIVWQKGMDLVVSVYHVSNAMPKEEIYGLTNQMRRAAVSIPSNVAEGYGRKSDRELLRFLGITQGSLCEMETQLTLAERLGFLKAEDLAPVFEQATDVTKLAAAFSAKLRSGLE